MRVEAVGEALGFLLRYRKYAAAGEHEAPAFQLEVHRIGAQPVVSARFAAVGEQAIGRGRPVSLLVHFEALAQPGFGRCCRKLFRVDRLRIGMPPPLGQQPFQRRKLESAIDIGEIALGPEQIGKQQMAMHAKVYH